MTIKPIIFSAPMVLALMAGRKTQTRRLCAWANNPNSPQLSHIVARDEPGWFGDEEGEVQFTVPYVPGDKLFVREGLTLDVNGEPAFTYAADGSRIIWSTREQVVWLNEYSRKQCPSIHMPRWASRLWLDVSEVRVERLQDISEADAWSEGLEKHPHSEGWAHIYTGDVAITGTTAKACYSLLWDELHTKPSTRWADNPWIVAYTFTVHEGNVDA